MEPHVKGKSPEWRTKHDFAYTGQHGINHTRYIHISHPILQLALPLGTVDDVVVNEQVNYEAGSASLEIRILRGGRSLTAWNLRKNSKATAGITFFMPAIYQLHRWICRAMPSSSMLIMVVVLSRLVSGFSICRFSSLINSRSTSRMSCFTAFNGHYSEIAIYSGAEEDIKESLNILSSIRPQLKVTESLEKSSSVNAGKRKENGIVWSAHCDNLQVDCTLLEPLYLGNNRRSNELTAHKWNEILDQRSNILSTSTVEDSKSKMRCLFEFYCDN